MATITGTNLNNVLTGTTGADQLSGLGGNDTLKGGLGNDVLIGGTGNDLYYVDSVGDKIQEPTSLGGERDEVLLHLVHHVLADEPEIHALRAGDAAGGGLRPAVGVHEARLRVPRPSDFSPAKLERGDYEPTHLPRRPQGYCRTVVEGTAHPESGM